MFGGEAYIPHGRLPCQIGLFVERAGACLAAKSAHAVEWLFAIPARSFGRQRLTAAGQHWHTGRNHISFVFRNLYGIQAFLIPLASTSKQLSEDYFDGIFRI